MDNLNYEVEKYLLVCKDTKGLSHYQSKHIKLISSSFAHIWTYVIQFVKKM